MPAVNGCIDVPHRFPLRQANHKQKGSQNNGVLDSHSGSRSIGRNDILLLEVAELRA
jgi:hypothetical protein